MPQLYRDRIGVICESYLNGDEGISPFASPLLWFESVASPTRELPPCFIGCGDKDPVLTDSQRLIRALEKRNAKFESRIYPNAIHAFQAFFWQENAIRFWREQLQFIAQFKVWHWTRIFPTSRYRHLVQNLDKHQQVIMSVIDAVGGIRPAR